MQTKLHVPRSALAAAAVSGVIAVSAMWTSFTLAQGRSTWLGWHIGEVAQRPGVLSDSDAAAIRTRTVGLLDALAIRPQMIEVSRSFDRLIGRTVDSATGFGPASKPIVSVDWEAHDGRLRALTRYLRDVSVSGAQVGRDDAARAAERYLKRAGLSTPSGDPEVGWDQGMQSWRTIWTRRIAGVPAPEDFVSVWVLPDGALRALSDLGDEPPSVPRRIISPSDAEAAVRRSLGPNLSPDAVVVEEPRLEWRHANDFVDPTLPDSPDPALRLVYVVRYSVTLTATERIDAMLWVDAASGELVGGGAIP